ARHLLAGARRHRRASDESRLRPSGGRRRTGTVRRRRGVVHSDFRAGGSGFRPLLHESRRGWPGASHEQGQIAPLVALVMVLIGLVAYGTAVLGRSAVDRARAQTAADAAALAG